MKKIFAPLSIMFTVAAFLYMALQKMPEFVVKNNKSNITDRLQIASAKEKEGGYKRWQYEWTLLHDPSTGQIPRDIFKKEKELLAKIQAEQRRTGFRTTVNNTYETAGPSQNGGRTRAVAFDMRTNQVMLAGGVSGGIFRSTNGGTTWTYVHPVNETRIISCLAQDPRPGFQDIWYAGTGELLGASPAYPNAFIPGNGILKSTNNGQTWTRLLSTDLGNSQAFDDLFDIVFNIQVDGSGRVYAAILNTIVRSSDGGSTWGSVLTSAADPNSGDVEGLATDIVISKNSTKFYAAFSGRNADPASAGVWQSTTGNSGTWTRIAGASSGLGLVSGWRAYDNSVSGGIYTAGWGKTVLAVAPSNANILWVMYDNAQSSENSVSEADLWRADLSGGSPSWSNRSAGLNTLIDNVDPSFMELQGGYNMLLAVHPTNTELVLAGGVNLFRSTDGFQNVRRFVGGLESNTYTDPNFASHVDFHAFAFDPSNVNRLIVASDGGLAVCNNITSTTPIWGLFSSNFQTYQFYHVAIDPTQGSRVFAGGAQDNSTTYLDSKSLLGPVLADPNDHYVGLIGGDGGMVGLSPSTATTQFLYASVQEGFLIRAFLDGANTSAEEITPDNTATSNFVTYYHLDNDNTNILYYVADDRIWRTTNATTATTSTGWTEMTGVATTLTADIYALATSRGTYNGSNSHLYIGTQNGRIFRLTNPRDVASSTNPVNISPSLALGMTSQSLVREIAVNPRNPDTVLAVVSNYGVASAFWSGNATSASPTWQAVEGNISLPSFRSCAIVVTNSGVEYYVGTSIGLFSTTAINGNSTNWTLEGPSVMQGAIISDLVLRPSDNTLLVGTHGNGMFVANIGNVVTSVPSVITNDKTFISAVTETVTRNNIYFQRGTQNGINKMNVQVLNASGQVVYRKDMPYSNGSIDVSNLSSGVYILDIWSDNRKFRHTQKFVKAQ
jgi:Secretion system C-terminal sorting domain